MPGNCRIQIWMIGMPNYDMSRSFDYFEAIGTIEAPKIVLAPPEARL